MTISPYEHGAIVAASLLVYVLVTRVGQQRRHPSAAIGWVLAIAVFPYLWLPIFLAFGSRKLPRPRRQAGAARSAAMTPLGPPWAMSLLASMDLDPAQRNASVVLQSDGEASFAAVLELIGAATRELAIGTFILGNDEIGDTVIHHLTAAAARGVRTRLLIDGIGSLQTSRRRLRQLREGGVEVRRFMPPLHDPRRGPMNLRNHRKIALADGHRLWSGGRNLAIEYFRDSARQPAWKDLSFVVIGPLAQTAQAQFDSDWRRAGGAHEAMDDRGPIDEPSPGGPAVQWVPTGPDRADDTVHALLMSAAYHATDRILAVTPYFVPDDALLEAWCIARRRGVRVCLAVPARSNHRLADLARERALRRLVDCGAEVKLMAGMVHAKAVVIDDALALCGSVNLDGRSLFLNYEAMAAFYGEAEIAWLADWILALQAQGRQHDGRLPSLPRDIVEGLVRSVGFQL